MSTFNKMQTFVAVVEENSFNQAAKKLGTSAAEVSRRISSLEAELKTTLLTRTTRKLTLTTLGEVYYKDCKKILEDVATANHRLLSQIEEPSGKLRVHYFDSNDILPRLSEFMQRYPKISLELSKLEQLPDFAKQEIDITIGISDDAPLADDSVRRKYGEVRYVLCASDSYLARHKPILNPADLRTHCYIGHLNRSSNTLKLKDSYNINLEPYLLMNETDEMVKAALNGLGLIWVHESRVRDHLASNALLEVLPKFAPRPLNHYLVYRYNDYLEAKIRVFVDFYTKIS